MYYGYKHNSVTHGVGKIELEPGPSDNKDCTKNNDSITAPIGTLRNNAPRG